MDLHQSLWQWRGHNNAGGSLEPIVIIVSMNGHHQPLSNVFIAAIDACEKLLYFCCVMCDSGFQNQEESVGGIEEGSPHRMRTHSTPPN